jgi:hypothetical protein
MSCCNQDCNQGRNCPNKDDQFSDRLAWALTIFIVALVVFIAAKLAFARVKQSPVPEQIKSNCRSEVINSIARLAR